MGSEHDIVPAAQRVRVGKGLGVGGVERAAADLPGIERARFWRDRKDGTVGFSENGADPLVSFEAGDGVDYESYAPALPLLTLVAE